MAPSMPHPKNSVYQFPFAVMLDEMDAIIAIPKDPVY
jgi:hypothetical protein